MSCHAVPHAVQRCVQKVLWFFLTWGDFQGSPSVADHASPLEKFFPAHILTVEGGRSQSAARSAGGFFLSTFIWQPKMKRRRTEGGPTYPYPKSEFRISQVLLMMLFRPRKSPKIQFPSTFMYVTDKTETQKGAPIRQRTKQKEEIWSLWGLNPRPSACKADALPLR